MSHSNIWERPVFPVSSILMVQYPFIPLVVPEIEPFSFKESGINGGGSARLMCTVVAGDTPLNITWLKDGQSVHKGVQQLDDFTMILSLSHLSLFDSGNYTCTASNSAGTAIHSSMLKVKGT